MENSGWRLAHRSFGFVTDDEFNRAVDSRKMVKVHVAIHL